MNLKFAPQAREDIRIARAWWQRNRDKSPQLLRDELKRAFALLKSQPLIGESALEVGAEGIRRFYLKGTRYFIFYGVVGEDLEILRLWHASRGEKPELHRDR